MSTASTHRTANSEGLALSKTVTYRDLKIRIYRQAESAVWRIDATKFGGKRSPTGKTTLEEAETFAEAFLREVSRLRDADPVKAAQRRVRDGIALTQGNVFDIFREKHVPKKKAGYRGSLETTMAYAEAILGRDLPVAGFDADAQKKYADARRSGDFTYVRPADEVEVKPARQPRHRTIFGELVALRTIFYAVGNEPGPDGNGTLLGFNPLRTIEYPYPLEPRAQWTMDDERTEALLAGLAEIDTSVVPGALRRVVQTIRGTGRRARSVLGLRRRDVLLDPAVVSQRAIRLCTVQGAGREWPFGALWWDREWEKKGIDGISPMSRRVHDLLVEHLALMDDKRPEAFLFPMKRDPSRPLPVSQLCNLLTDAETAARAMGYELEEVAWLKNHGWRREFRSARTNLMDDKLVANVVGWDLRGDDTAAMNASYKQYPARAWYLCVEYLPGRDTTLGRVMMGVHVHVNVPAPREASGELVGAHSNSHSPGESLPEAA